MSIPHLPFGLSALYWLGVAEYCVWLQRVTRWHAARYTSTAGSAHEPRGQR